jgi:hypothetical protein
MTRKEFQNLCEDISYDDADENWSSAEKLREIAIAVSNVALDFNADVAMHPDFGEEISDV